MCKKTEKMNEFFDVRADIYDRHMQKNIENFSEFYNAVIEPISFSEEKLELLDIGCGTGLELDGIFFKLPNSIITCNDISDKMMEKLKEKYTSKSSQIKYLKGSYTELEFTENHFDFVVSVMTVHHLLPEPKIALYKKLRKSLKEGGVYVEGDFVVDPKTAEQYRTQYDEITKNLKEKSSGFYHLDLPFSVETQLKLFRQAGFSEIDVYWKKAFASVFVCKR